MCNQFSFYWLNTCTEHNNCTNISSDDYAIPVTLEIKLLCSKIALDFLPFIEPEPFMIKHGIVSFLSHILAVGKLDFPCRQSRLDVDLMKC